jgi:hypothetical protein
MVPVPKATGNVAVPPASKKANPAAVVAPSVRRAADDPAKARVPAGGRVKVKNGNVMKTNRRKG